MTLTTALILLGLGVLVALALQGWWATRRLQAHRPADSRLPAERVEPALGDATPTPAFDDTADADADDGLTLPRPAARRLPRLDALIDAIVPLALDAPITGALALAHLPPSRRVGSKALLVEGLDTETGQWEALAPERRYGELQAGVLLASRSGPLNEIEYSEFVQKVQAFAEAVGATPDAPDMLEVVGRARELDALVSPLDAQLSIRLRANGVAWSVAYVQQVAHKLGFVPGAVPGRLVLPSPEDDAPPMLVLTVDAQAALAAIDDSLQASGVRECVLTLDVPQTHEAAEPFPAWHRAATQLADDLDATAVDNEGQPITLQNYATIGHELGDLYRQLQALDVAAGSAAARRLFS
jgi:hypothetical protein